MVLRGLFLFNGSVCWLGRLVVVGGVLFTTGKGSFVQSVSWYFRGIWVSNWIIGWGGISVGYDCYWGSIGKVFFLDVRFC